jgi:hypothetical protein
MSYTVTVAHHANPDVRGGYWTPPLDDGTEHKRKAETLRECIAICRAYIERNGLGGGNWGGGIVRRDGEAYAYVSYNGRAWDKPIGADMRYTHELDPDTGEQLEEA